MLLRRYALPTTRFLVSSTIHRTLVPRSLLHSSSALAMSAKTPWDPKQTKYPPTWRSDTVETFKSATRGDVKVPDPFDWLHHPDAPETVEWVNSQTDFTREYLDKYKDRKRFAEELRKNWDYPRCALAPSRARRLMWGAAHPAG